MFLGMACLPKRLDKAGRQEKKQKIKFTSNGFKGTHKQIKGKPVGWRLWHIGLHGKQLESQLVLDRSRKAWTANGQL